ncbi:MAG: ABC transporter permease [Thermoleophilia bacterium]|nr:ABC transporter permease [Thermoleophilia bacterium]
MRKVALRGLAGRKLRALLTALAIVLGVAMVSGTFVLTDTIDRAFNTIFERSYAGTDAVVRAGGSDIAYQGLTAELPGIPAELLEQVRAVPSVEVATGLVMDETSAKILDRKGKAVDTQGAPAFGFGVDPSPELSRFNPLNLVEGRWPTGGTEVVIDAGTADEQRFALGERVKVASLGPVREFEVVGIAQYSGVSSLGTATFAVFDVRTAQELFGREDEFDAISVAAKQGVDDEALVADLEEALPPTVAVQTGDERADEERGEVAEFTTFIRYFLLAFGGIALFVGAFVIFNTLSITVAQRTREFATLRTIGASRRQVLGSVVLEALVIGVLASVTGLLLGVALAYFLNWLFRVLGLDLPTTAMVFAPRTAVVALLVGVVVTLVAGLFPAVRATRVPAIAAVREGATLPGSRFARFTPYVAVALIAGAVSLLAFAMFADDLDTEPRLLSIAGGTLGLFLGVGLLSPKVVRPVAGLTHEPARWVVVVLQVVAYPVTLAFWLLRYAAFYADRPAGRRAGAAAWALAIVGAFSLLVALLGGGPVLALVPLVVPLTVIGMAVAARVSSFTPEWPLDFPDVRPAGATARVGRENARRAPGRTAATAAALMIGLALVTFVATLADGMKASNRDAIESQVRADYVVTSQDGYAPFVAAAGEAAARAPGIELSTDVRSDLATLAGSDRYLTGIEPGRIAQAYRFQWLDGSDAVLSRLGADGAILDKDFAEDKELAVGDRFTAVVPSGQERQLVVRGIYEPPPFYPLLGNASIAKETFDELYDRPRNQFTFVNVPGEPTEAAKQRLAEAVAAFPDAKVQTREEWIAFQDADFNQFLTMLYVLLALSVIVSLFGMVNTLVLSVFERTRELGMMRAVGMTRRQARRMIRHESVITALIGAALGLPLGIFLAMLVTRALSQFDVQFRVPLPLLLVFTVIAVLAGIAAAVLPARRAARLRVLEALHYE